MKPTKKDYGWSAKTGWINGRVFEYNDAIEAWLNRPTLLAGRIRTKPVHPSWEPYDALFNRLDPTRSQGAFCRWAGMATTSVSSAKYRQISPRMAKLIEDWKAIMEAPETIAE